MQRRFMPHRYRRTSHGIIATEGDEMEILGENGYLKVGSVEKIPFVVSKKNSNLFPVFVL